jgi:hypothetical protein
MSALLLNHPCIFVAGEIALPIALFIPPGTTQAGELVVSHLVV